MDAIISNVLLFLKDSGLNATLEALALELEVASPGNPGIDGAQRRGKANNQSFNNLREKLHELIDRTNLDASDYPHLFSIVKQPVTTNEHLNDSNSQLKSTLSRQVISKSFRLENKGINNLMSNCNDTASRSDNKKSEGSHRDDCDFSFQKPASRSQTQMVLEPFSKHSNINRESRNLQSLGNLKKASHGTSRSNLDVLSGEHDSEIGELDDSECGEGKDYQPFYTNEGMLISHTEVRARQI